jgi:hypothetical protein
VLVNGEVPNLSGESGEKIMSHGTVLTFCRAALCAMLMNVKRKQVGHFAGSDNT